LTDKKAEETNTLPLFYKAPEAVGPVRHGNRGLAQTGDFGFAAKAIVFH